MSIPAGILTTRHNALLAHCHTRLGVPSSIGPTGNTVLTSGFTEIRLNLTGGGMHVAICKTAGPPFGSHAEEGMKHGVLTNNNQLMPAWSVDLAGREVKQVWLSRGTTNPGIFWLSACTVGDIAKVEAVVTAMIVISQFHHRREE